MLLQRSDSNGRLILERHDYCGNGKLMSEIIYTRNEKGKIIKTTIFLVKDGELGKIRQRVY